MELGMTPILTSSFVMQILMGLKMIDVNMGSKEDRELFMGSMKLFGILVTFG